MPIVVKKQKGETKEDLISRFRRLFVEEGIVEEIKRRVEYIKKSRQRYERRKEQERRRRRQRQLI